MNAFQKFLEILSAVKAMFPLIVQFVRDVENAFPPGGFGAQKLALVRAWLESAFDKANDFGLTFDDLWPKIAAVVSSLVTAYNAIGVFRRAAEQPAKPS